MRLGLAEREAILRSAGPYLTPAKMARTIGISTAAIYDRTRKGKLLATKIKYSRRLSAWQVKHGRLLPGLEDALVAWARRDFPRVFSFESPNIFLDERTPRGALLAGQPEPRTWGRASLRQTRSEVTVTKAEVNRTISLTKARLRTAQVSEAVLGLMLLLGVGELELSRILQIPRARLHKKVEGDDFTAEEHAHMLHLTELIRLAFRIFGNIESVREWLRAPNPTLGRPPLSMLSSDHGRIEAERVLGRIEDGVFS